jgi:acetamidase/formamidase
MKRQSGTTTVEFAIVGAVALALMFTVIEFSRILFSLNVLDESARRATRVAAVCAVGDAEIASAATFVSLPNLSDSNVVAEYLDQDGATLGDPAGADYAAIEFVRVRIVDYGFPVALPFIASFFNAPEISATMPRESLGVPKEKIPPELYAAFEGAPGEGRDDHTLDGPIAVRGAEPGDTVEIKIRSIDLWLPIAGMGFRANRGSLPEDFPYSRDRVLFFDPAKKEIEFAPGVIVPAKPFWGVIGVAPPPSMGRVPSGPPNVFGGNLDNHDLQPGTSLFLPVHTRGALISIGDGHAVQGAGEVGMSAVETSLKGEIQVVLHKGMRITWPRAETPTHYMTMGLSDDLDQAAKIATREMLNFIAETKRLPRDDVLMLLSAAMDLNVTQIVDGTKGIHATMPKSIFQR